MAEKKDQYLTLEFDGSMVTADKFELGFRSFLNVIRNVTRTISGEIKAIEWIVGITPGSMRIDFMPQAEASITDMVPVILETIVDGIASVEKHSIRPKHFSDGALKNASILASVIDRKDTGLNTIKVRLARKSTEITPES